MLTWVLRQRQPYRALEDGLGSPGNWRALYASSDVKGTYTNEASSTWTINFNKFGSALKVVDPAGKVTDYEINAENLVTKRTDPDPDDGGAQVRPVTTFGHDSKGNITSITHPDTTQETWTFDATFSQPTSYTNRIGDQVTFVVDPAIGNITEMRQVNGGGSNDSVTTLGYTTTNVKGLVSSVTDPRGFVTNYGRDAQGLVTSVTYAAGTADEAIEEFSYDAFDNLQWSEDGLNRKTEYLWDKLDRLTTITLPDPDGVGPLSRPVYAYEYNKNNYLKKETDPLSRVTEYVYNGRNDLIEVKQPDPDGGGGPSELAGRSRGVRVPRIRQQQKSRSLICPASVPPLRTAVAAGALILHNERLQLQRPFVARSVAMALVSRRQVLGAAAAATMTAAGRHQVRGQEPTSQRSGEALTPETQRAIDRGLTWLGKRQIASGRHEGAFGTGGYPGGVAVCSLSGLAFMCSGSSPGQGPFGRNIERAVKYITSCVQESGYISAPGFGQDNMYGHGFGMLFLSEAYGMMDQNDADAHVGDKLRAAVKLTCSAQNDAGGWRYQPVKSDADLSITICQIMGLRAARDAGLHVPDEVREKCIDYVKKSQNADGSFRYQIRSGGSGTFPLTAAGVVALYSAGIYDSPEVEKGLAWLMRHLPGSGGNASYHGHFFYGQYYAVQAMWHAGGDYWRKWYPAIVELLVKRQSSNGSWADSEVCPEFGTAMACIILQMPNNYLPIFTP